MNSAALQPEYSCARCDANCPTKAHLLKHMILTHRSLHQSTKRSKFNYKCPTPTCGKEFSELHKFNTHLFYHQQHKFNCSKCAKIFWNRKDLQKHSFKQHGIEVTHETPSYKCDDCGGIFTSLRSFTQHSALHKPPQFSCDECDRNFFSWSGVLSHKKMTHLGKKMRVAPNICQFSCELCPLQLATANSLKLHLANVHQPKEHKCPHCYREFAIKWKFNAHLLKAHSVVVEKYQQCTICQKVCRGQANLALHLQSHANPTVSCGQCDLKFHTVGGLSTHVAKIHTIRFTMPAQTNNNEINYTCAVCCKPVGSKNTLLRHVKIHNFKPQSCPVCQKMFYSDRRLTEHIRQNHPDSSEKFHCDFCNKHFPSLKSYQRHMKYHQKPTMACPNCPLLFYSKMTLQSHSKSHNSEAKSKRKGYSNGTEIFSCAVCLRQFPLRPQLRDHLNSTHNPPTFGCSKCDFQCYVRVGITTHLRKFHPQSC